MKIKDFVQGRNVSYDTVRKYIINHQQEFKGHIGKANNIVLDDVAIQILDQKYPLAQPVQVVQDVEARDRLAVLQEKYISLLEENNRLTQENANLMLAHHKNMLLEEELEAQQQELHSLRKEQRSWVKDRQEQRNREAQLQQELEREKNKTWWDKLLGR